MIDSSTYRIHKDYQPQQEDPYEFADVFVDKYGIIWVKPSYMGSDIPIDAATRHSRFIGFIYENSKDINNLTTDLIKWHTVNGKIVRKTPRWAVFSK